MVCENCGQKIEANEPVYIMRTDKKGGFYRLRILSDRYLCPFCIKQFLRDFLQCS